jgi:hypothetical protein
MFLYKFRFWFVWLGTFTITTGIVGHMIPILRLLYIVTGVSLFTVGTLMVFKK